MKNWVFLVLALSIGLNIGLVGMYVGARDADRGPSERREWRSDRDSGERRERTPEEHAERRRRFIDRRFDRLAKELSLTEEQRAAFRAVHDEYLPRIFEKRDAAHARRAEMMERLQSASTKEEVQALVAEGGEVQREIDSLVIEAMFRQIGTLDQEQREKYLAQFPWGRELGGPGDFGRGRDSRHRKDRDRDKRDDPDKHDDRDNRDDRPDRSGD